jgi:hypothetical protein
MGPIVLRRECEAGALLCTDCARMHRFQQTELSELSYTQMARRFLEWPAQLVWPSSDWDRPAFRWRTAADEVPPATNSANWSGATGGLK